MSIINKMHQELQKNNEDSPILSTLPVKKDNKRVFLVVLITLLVISAVSLSYLIYTKKEADTKSLTAPIDVLSQRMPIDSSSSNDNSATAEIKPSSEVMTPNNEPIVKATEKAVQSKALTSPVVAKPSVSKAEVQQPIKMAKPVPVPASIKVSKEIAKVSENKPISTKNEPVDDDVVGKEIPHLEIKESVLSDAEIADIHINNAKKALQKGDTALVAEENRKALALQPQLHKVRQSLALYYYGINEPQRGNSLLQQGALLFPEYSDFNLMLARIALKNNDRQKAYLYLQQQAPVVQGHLDYHVTYAILAQKFKHYEKAESLYQGLLTQRPNNGRWMMSLAIAQDKQGKQALAIKSYQHALLQIDLSSKAKKFINQRLTYLANQ